MNYYERHLGDYAKDTAHLSMLEHGAYGLLLDRYYATECGIPEDQAHRLARARTKEEKQAVDSVLGEFFTLVNGVWINNRASDEITKAQSKIKAAQENGKRGGRPKSNQTKTQEKPTGLSLGSQNETELKAYQTPNTNHQTPIPVDTHTHYQPTESVCMVSPVGDCCKALVDAGIPATSINQGHPKLLALVEAGATVIEFGETARECVGKGNPGFAYVLGTMTRRREQAAATNLHQGAMPRKSTPGQRSADAAQRWLDSQENPLEAHG